MQSPTVSGARFHRALLTPRLLFLSRALVDSLLVSQHSTRVCRERETKCYFQPTDYLTIIQRQRGLVDRAVVAKEYPVDRFSLVSARAEHMSAGRNAANEIESEVGIAFNEVSGGS